MAKVRYENWLLSVEKWGRVTRACMEENAEELSSALTYMVCGYCRQDVERQKASPTGNYAQCSGCDLKKKDLCGEESSPDAFYWRVEDADGEYTFKQKLRAANKVFSAILADCPKRIRPKEWD
jgi:hypothetical protein